MFKKLKEKFTKELILTVLDLDKKIRMEVNVLDYAMSSISSMNCKNGWWRLVVIFSKSLNEIERNYKIYNKEILVVIRELENWRYLLEGGKFKFKAWTDHKNLGYFMKTQKLNRKQAHYALYLSRFDFTLKHVPDTKIQKANGLSRRPDWKVWVDNNNNNQILIKEQ